jgi:hypothetical protein
MALLILHRQQPRPTQRSALYDNEDGEGNEDPAPPSSRRITCKTREFLRHEEEPNGTRSTVLRNLSMFREVGYLDESNESWESAALANVEFMIYDAAALTN